MRAVTTTFLQAIQYPHRLMSNFTYTVPAGQPVQLQVAAGTVTLDTSQRTRRTAGLTVYGSQADYAAITTPGAVFHIDHGLDFGGGQTELLPVFHGEITSAVQRVGDGTITLQLADHMNWLARCGLVVPYSPLASHSRVAAISDLVTTAKPGTSVVVTATDTGAVGSQTVWTDSTVDAITSLCRDGAMDAYFQPDGTFLIADLPSATTTVAWTASGILETVERTRPMDKLYNTVVVRPAATDGSQTWPQQTAAITDTTDPRHPSKIGVVPYFWPSPTAVSIASAQKAAQAILFRVRGTTETLNLGLISNPALEGNDLIRVVVPALNQDPANIYQHYVDGFTLDLVTGSMSLATRQQPTS